MHYKNSVTPKGIPGCKNNKKGEKRGVKTCTIQKKCLPLQT